MVSAHLAEMASQGLDEPPGTRRSQVGRMRDSEDQIMYGDRSREVYDAVIAVQNRKAVQVVASQATGMDDCVELLAMLGLTAEAR